MKSKNISIVKTENGAINSVLLTQYVIDRYSLGFENLLIKIKSVPELKQALAEYNFKVSEFHIGLKQHYDILESEDFLLIIEYVDKRDTAMVSMYFNSYEESVPLFYKIKEFEDLDNELYIAIEDFYIDGQGTLTSSFNVKYSKDFLEIKESYYPYLDVQELFKQFILSDSNILVLCGLPGIGKSKLSSAYMKFLLEEYKKGNLDKSQVSAGYQAVLTDTDDDEDDDYTFKETEELTVCYVKNEDILSRDDFWGSLKNSAFNLVILDDLDYGLLPRTQDVSTAQDIAKNKFLSQFLSFTDGIHEKNNKTKFIITTNREVKEIDKAVLRKGRTFDILELRHLRKEEARTIWLAEGLPESTFDEKFTSEYVLQSDLGSDIQLTKKIKDRGIEIHNYIKEDGISLYNKIKNPKKIGV